MSSTIVLFSSRTMMKEARTIAMVKDEESSAYPGLGQMPHKRPREGHRKGTRRSHQYPDLTLPCPWSSFHEL